MRHYERTTDQGFEIDEEYGEFPDNHPPGGGGHVLLQQRHELHRGIHGSHRDHVHVQHNQLR